MVNILLVTQEGCTPCKRVRRILEAVIRENPSLQIREVKFSSPEGTKLATDYQILYPPAVFIDGRLFGKGKIREDDLKNVLLRTIVANDNTVTS